MKVHYLFIRKKINLQIYIGKQKPLDKKSLEKEGQIIIFKPKLFKMLKFAF